MVRREVIADIGEFDEINFPVDYGEENDFCIRAANAGYELAIADDAYVFHAKSKSFGHERREALSAEGSKALARKHSRERVAALVSRIKNETKSGEIRTQIANELSQPKDVSASSNIFPARIMFLLPVSGGGGGAHSVVQEATEMRKCGIDVKVGIIAAELDKYLTTYKDIKSAKQLFEPLDYDHLTDFGDHDIVVAIIFSSVRYLHEIAKTHPHVLPCYYTQDYEPLFFQSNSENWQEARSSYTLCPNAVLFAKSKWIAHRIYEERRGRRSQRMPQYRS